MGLIGVLLVVLQGRAGSQIFSASTLFLAGMLASAAVTLFPYLLPGYPLWQNGLSAYSYPPSPAALATTLRSLSFAVRVTRRPSGDILSMQFSEFMRLHDTMSSGRRVRRVRRGSGSRRARAFF